MSIDIISIHGMYSTSYHVLHIALYWWPCSDRPVRWSWHEAIHAHSSSYTENNMMLHSQLCAASSHSHASLHRFELYRVLISTSRGWGLICLCPLELLLQVCLQPL